MNISRELIAKDIRSGVAEGFGKNAGRSKK